MSITTPIVADNEKNIIRALEEIIPDCTFILAGRAGSPPKNPYCIVSILNRNKQSVQRTNTTKLDVSGKGWQTVLVDYLITYTITFEGEAKSKSEEWCDYLAIAMDSDFGQEVLDKHGMGFMDYQAIPRINLNINGNTAFVNDTISLTILTTRMEDFPVGYINRVQVKGDLNFVETFTDTNKILLSDSGEQIISSLVEVEIDVDGNG